MEFVKANIPAPKLTTVTTEDNSNYTIYGVAIVGKQKAKAKISEEKCSWLLICQTTLLETKDIEIEHTEVKVFKETYLGHYQIHQLWNGGELGRFNFEKNIPKDLNDDQHIYARSYIYGKFDCQSLVCEYGNALLNNHNESGKSNRVLLVRDVKKEEVKDILYKRFKNDGTPDDNGEDHIMIIKPDADNLDFKVTVGLDNKLEDVNPVWKGKKFSEITSDQNSILDGNKPFAAINADYIHTDNKPLAFNVSRGKDFSGTEKDKRSGLAISKDGKAKTVSNKKILDDSTFHAAGGNGRVYTDGVFNEGACGDIGFNGCNNKKSLFVITDKGYLILLTNNNFTTIRADENGIGKFMDNITSSYNLGSPRNGVFFDQGSSPGMMWDGKVLVENTNPIGSAILIYKK